MTKRTPKMIVATLVAAGGIAVAPTAALAQDGYSSGTIDPPPVETPEPEPVEPAPVEPAPPAAAQPPAAPVQEMQVPRLPVSNGPIVTTQSGRPITASGSGTNTSSIGDRPVIGAFAPVIPSIDVNAGADDAAEQAPIIYGSNPGITGNADPITQIGPDGAPPAELALTGPETPYLAFSGLGLIALGVAASAAARRRITTT